MNERINELKNLLAEADRDYWKNGASRFADEEYDAMREEYKKLTGEPESKFGTPEILASGKVRHARPMLSMQKVYDISKVVAWARKYAKGGDILVMPKYDGIALRKYPNGTIATRGDGEIVPPWTWDKKTHQPVLKIRKKKVVRNKSEKYTESNRRNISKSHEARRADPVRAREIATNASMAAKAKVSPEERKKICAKARAVLLLKRESMTPEEREEAHRRRVDAAKRSHETRRRNAALKAAEADKKSEHVDSKE